MLFVFVRDLKADGTPDGPWRLTGQICSQDPNAPAGAPVVTPEMVERAFEHLPFTPAVTAVEPVGRRTLVNLPTYYRATFPSTRIHGRASTGPGDHAHVTLLGHDVTITPHATTYRYAFGDGATAGPTSDAGGGWPSGTLTHTYTHHGRVRVRITTTYSGTYTVDGGEQIPLTGTVSIRGAALTLTVLSATNRLYSGPP